MKKSTLQFGLVLVGMILLVGPSWSMASQIDNFTNSEHDLMIAEYPSNCYPQHNPSQIGVIHSSNNGLRTLMQFDLGSDLSGRTVTAATLTLNWARWSGTGPASGLQVYEVLRYWEHSDVCWSNRDKSAALTWNTGGAGTLGTDVAATPFDSGSWPSSTTYEDVVITLPITLVQGWIDSGATNYGMLLRTDESTTYQTAYIHGATSANPPKLTVTTIPEPATMVLLGLGGVGLLIRRRRKA